MAPPRKPKVPCLFDCCVNHARHNGYCGSHYTQILRGKPLQPLDIMRRKNLSVEERLFSRVEKTETCWLWVGCKGSNGYAVSAHAGRWRGCVHRWFYEHYKGEIPEGLVIDHLCRVRHCVNPDHLEAVTFKENVMRGVGVSVKMAEKTHCDYGHPLEGENLKLYKGVERRCRICLRRRDNEYHERKRQRQLAEGKQTRRNKTSQKKWDENGNKIDRSAPVLKTVDRSSG